MSLPFPPPVKLPQGFTMSRCTPQDVQDMDAFSNSEYTYWWGRVEPMRSWQAERIAQRFQDAAVQQFKVVDDANGVIVAWAKWDPPSKMVGLREGFTIYDEAGQPVSTSSSLHTHSKGAEGTGKEASNLGPPAGSNIALFHGFFDGITRMEEKHQASEKLVLTHLCTRHSHHGRGLGSVLLASVLELADKEGLSTYLEATRVGVSLYQGLGFEIVDKLEFDRSETGLDTPAVLQIMVREPRAP
ncbi:hypothetical protein F5B22DRAFT_634797 [Xylaria bambusicola]|uniref:uncharacterized protein n=1 Tax=Xylaria bambusicola TaxID=326684 RepID=UPI0020082831|nr:uncharacterized protein F5B22DRAFT_634797 [Xylaria bambusicola]KAI0521445.1 hypothetical protein F5B22DRAFT_634797 [Xylaria bambusicola]